MSILKGYVHLEEVTRRSGVAPSYISMVLNDESFPVDPENIILRLGGVRFIRKEALRFFSKAVRDAGERCRQFEHEIPLKYAAELFGVAPKFFEDLIAERDEVSFENSAIRRIFRDQFGEFVELDPYLSDLIGRGYTPYPIKKKDDAEYAEKIFDAPVNGKRLAVGLY